MLNRGSGYILNICSFSGIVATFGYTAYASSKFAIRGFSDALRMEMKPRGVGISVIFPTDTDTPQLAYENQFKPPETRAVNGTAGMNTADNIAKYALKSIERGQYFILPNLEAQLYYRLNGISAGFVNYLADQIVANAIKKKNSSNTKKGVNHGHF